MSWAKIDDRANEHAKLLAAGAEAAWFWVCGLMYANRQKRRDGFIPASVLPMLYPTRAPSRLAKKLCDVGLWTSVDGGFEIHDFLDWNESAVERDTRLALNARRSALTKNPELRKRLKARDGNHCRYCGDEISWTSRRGPKSATYDHVIPVSQGGSDEDSNLVVCCQQCNNQKHARKPEEAGMKLLPVPGSDPSNQSESGPRSDSGNPGSTPLPLPLPLPLPIPSSPQSVGGGSEKRRPGLAGFEVNAYCEGIKAGTKRSFSTPPTFERARIADGIETHCPLPANATAQEILTWLRDDAERYASLHESAGKAALQSGYKPSRWVDWHNAGCPDPRESTRQLAAKNATSPEPGYHREWKPPVDDDRGAA